MRHLAKHLIQNTSALFCRIFRLDQHHVYKTESG